LDEALDLAANVDLGLAFPMSLPSDRYLFNPLSP